MSEKGRIKGESKFFFFARVSGKVELASTKMTNSEKGVDLGGSNWNERSLC